ncbi:hypothetical protein [Streptomyces sp. NPDC059349]|uniref:hypothetical protein n=1 Tax=Streptomyces sp. NPDC059349 TaxID=3346808 RepID=UPI00368A3020
MSIRPPSRHRSSHPARGERRGSARPDCGSPPQELLQIAQTLPGDPACLDLGVMDAVCARVQAH